MFRFENASSAVEGALGTALALSQIPRERHGKAFREAIAQWRPMAEELRDFRQGLVPSPAPSPPAQSSGPILTD
ncbi:hypothetical protein [Nocardioides sp. AN3]